MIRNWSGIRVGDVRASSRWYRDLLGCRSFRDDPDHHPHGELFDQLRTDDGSVVLCLISWDGHENPWAGAKASPGCGVSLDFVVDDVDAAWQRAQTLGAPVVEEPHQQESGYRTRSFTVRDPDGYYLTLLDAKTGFPSQA